MGAPGSQRGGRLVLLGASNLHLGLGELVAAARAALPGRRLSVYVAAGHGRSFGVWHRFLFVYGLPGIVDCELWEAVAEGERPVYALVTDVGNDLAYGFAPAAVAGWVGTCLERLAAMDAHTVVTRLPLASLERLAPWRFRLAGALFFPGRRIRRAALLRGARELDTRLGELAARHGAVEVIPDPEWYGADGIHLRRRERPAAWRAMLAPLLGGAPPPAVRRRRLHLGRPSRRRLLGLELKCSQPSARHGAGLEIYRF